MKSLRLLGLAALVSFALASTLLAQSPAITKITVVDTGCIYIVGTSTKLCSVATRNDAHRQRN